MRSRLSIWIVALLAALLASVSVQADDKLSKEELDQLLAPIALYPDELLTNVLIASTYPLDVVQASRWRQQSANAKLKGDALAKALEAKEWDPSIKSLVQFPDVLKTMSDKLDWTQKLGDAFLAQQSEVMDEIQFLRAKADEAGNLKSNKQQKVVKESGSGGGRPVYIIEPADPEIVYVPVYQPTVVYGSWWYPSYPPYYWGYPGASFVNGFFWAAGIAIAADIWDWNRCDWHRHDIDINVNKWNNINGDRDRINNGKWQHRPEHRGPVPYRNKEVRDKFGKADRAQIGNKEFRGRDKAEIQDRLKATDHSRVKDRPDRDTRDAARDKAGDRPQAKTREQAGGRDKAGERPKGKTREQAGDRGKSRDVSKKSTRDVERPKAQKRPAPGAFDVKRGADVRRNADRGRASRQAMAPRPHAGGGGRAHRGGGGGRGGGRRR